MAATGPCCFLCEWHGRLCDDARGLGPAALGEAEITDAMFMLTRDGLLVAVATPE